MSVALYHPWIYLKGGIERTLLALATRSRHDWTIFTSHYEPDATFPQFRQLKVVELTSVSVRRSTASVGAACLRLLLEKPDFRSFDALMISCDGVSNLLALRVGGLPILCFCHTPLKIAHDSYTRRRWPEMQRPSLLTRGAVHLYTLLDRWAWRRYQRVFCNSEEVRQCLVRSHLAQPEQIEVVRPGVDTDHLVPSGRCQPYFLLPGRIVWTKNIELGIEALRTFKANRPLDDPFRLVIAGAVDEKSGPYLTSLRRQTDDDNAVEFILDPPDDELYSLYDSCYAVLFPPPNEDWGIVPLEAMAYGKPVLAVNQGGPRESVVHGETGSLLEPSAYQFASAMAKLADDPALYRRISKAARARACQFHWRYFIAPIDSYIDTLGQRHSD